MKKIIELENRWKAYKYRTTIFYVFVAVLVAFIIMLGVFIKFQIYDKSVLVKKHDSNANLAQSNVPKNALPPNQNQTTNPSIDSNQKSAKINFTCRQVTVNKLTVRQNASFRSKALGHYSRDSIFCASSKSVNGLLKTPNGWVSANDAYSQVVNVNMFVDTGFYKYQGTSGARIIAQRNAPKTSVEEVRVFDKPNRSFSNAESSAISTKPKSKPIITSQNLTKEKMIEFKESDFRNTKDYNTALEVARFYYDAKNYDESIRWALNASNADSKGKQKTESFIIYAKSLYLSGKQDQAFEVLNRYISSTNAPDAIDALNKMKEGII
mgnify:CR=1 FL=1